MKYAAIGHAVTHRIVCADGRIIPDIMGGGGFYAYSGLLFSDPDALFISGVGRDFDRYYGEWFDRNGASREGLKYRTDYGSYNELKYLDAGRWEERSIYGPVLRGVFYWESDIFAHDLEPYMAGLRGIHTSGLWENVYLDKMAEMRGKYGYKIMWECPPPESISEKNRPQIEKIINVADIWSLNAKESFALFDVDSERAALDAIVKLGKPCLYRVGARGAYMISGGETAFSPAYSPVPEQRETDPTGCGSAASAAALWAFCEGMSLKEICTWACIAAGHNAAQLGPVGVITPEKRAEAMETLRRLCGE